MRILMLGLSLLLFSACGTGLKKVDTCENKVYLGCPVGKLQCLTDANGCRQCQCQL